MFQVEDNSDNQIEKKNSRGADLYVGTRDRQVLLCMQTDICIRMDGWRPGC